MKANAPKQDLLMVPEIEDEAPLLAINNTTDFQNDPKISTAEETDPLKPYNEYEKSCMQRKIGRTAAYIITVRGMASLYLLTYQYAYGMAGFILGLITQAIASYYTVYGQLKLLNLINVVEKQNNDEIRISAYHEQPYYCCVGKTQTFLKGFIMFGTMIQILLALMLYIAQITCFIQNHIWDGDTRIIKLVIIGIALVILLLTVEPEKYKYISMPVFGIIVIVYLTIFGKFLHYIFKDFDHQVSVSYSLFRWENFLLSLSMNIFGCGNSSILTVRNTMKEPKNMPIIYKWAYFTYLNMLVPIGFICYYAFENEFLVSNILLYFPGNQLFDVLNYVFIFSIMAWFPFLIISILEQLESLSCIKNFLNCNEVEISDEFSHKKAKLGSIAKIRLMRFVGGVILYSQSLISNDIEAITSYGGIFCVPLVWFVTPVALAHMKNHLDGIKASWKVIVHDACFVLSSVIFIILALLNKLNIV